MPNNFLTLADKTDSSLEGTEVSTEARSPQREPLRVLVIGSRQGVTSTIQTLYRLRFADVGEWSPLMPTSTPGEVMSILTRYFFTS